MTTHRKDDPPTPLKTLKGTGYSGIKKSEAAPAQSEGERSLRALDNMLTASMRRDGLLPPPNDPPPVPATPPPNIADYDPLKMPVWTLVMALAWISTRSLVSVTWQRDDWRREVGWPEASVPTSIDPDGEEDHPAFYLASAALAELKAKGEAGALEVRAMSLTRNQPTVLTPLDWSYGSLQFNRQFDEVWVVGSEAYVRLTIGHDKLRDAFPSVSNEEETGRGAPKEMPPPSQTETPDRAQTRIALAAMAICYPKGIPKGRGEIKMATNQMDAKFEELAAMEGLNLRPPKARKWQILRNNR